RWQADRPRYEAPFDAIAAGLLRGAQAMVAGDLCAPGGAFLAGPGAPGPPRGPAGGTAAPLYGPPRAAGGGAARTRRGGGRGGRAGWPAGGPGARSRRPPRTGVRGGGGSGPRGGGRW